MMPDAPIKPRIDPAWLPQQPNNRELRVGVLAYYDSMSGLLPCKVLAIKPREGHDTADTRPSSNWLVTVKLTANKGPWKRGEIFTDMWSLNVIPRGAIFRRSYQFRIGHYTVNP